MRKFFKCVLLIALIQFADNSSAQNSTGKDSSDKKINSIKNLYYNINILYPKKALEEGIQGTVILSFDVDSTCSIVNRKVEQSVGYGCDEAALSVLVTLEKKMKKDQKSKCEKLDHMVIPVQFKLH